MIFKNYLFAIVLFILLHRGISMQENTTGMCGLSCQLQSHCANSTCYMCWALRCTSPDELFCGLSCNENKLCLGPECTTCRNGICISTKNDYELIYESDILSQGEIAGIAIGITFGIAIVWASIAYYFKCKNINSCCNSNERRKEICPFIGLGVGFVIGTTVEIILLSEY